MALSNEEMRRRLRQQTGQEAGTTGNVPMAQQANIRQNPQTGAVANTTGATTSNAYRQTLANYTGAVGSAMQDVNQSQMARALANGDTNAYQQYMSQYYRNKALGANQPAAATPQTTQAANPATTSAPQPASSAGASVQQATIPADAIRVDDNHYYSQDGVYHTINENGQDSYLPSVWGGIQIPTGTTITDKPGHWIDGGVYQADDGTRYYRDTLAGKTYMIDQDGNRSVISSNDPFIVKGWDGQLHDLRTMDNTEMIKYGYMKNGITGELTPVMDPFTPLASTASRLWSEGNDTEAKKAEATYARELAAMQQATANGWDRTGGESYWDFLNRAQQEQNGAPAEEGGSASGNPDWSAFLEALNQWTQQNGGGGSGGGNAQPQGTQTPAYQAVGNPYQAYLGQFEYEKAPQWEGTEYERKRDEALQRAEDMRWSYDPNTDPVWQAYQKQYRREGDRATQNTLAQAAGLTGGQLNSWATTAAAQAGNYYASQLSDKLPQLYQDSYNRYLQEFQRQLGISDQYEQQGQTEYSRYLDRLGQFNTDRNFQYGLNRDAVNDARYADETAYNRAWNEDERDYSRAWNEDERGYNRAWNEDERDYSRDRDALGDSRYEQEQAYQRSRDALSDARYADEMDYRQEQDAMNWDYKNRALEADEAQNGYDNARKERELAFSMQKWADQQARADAQWDWELYEDAMDFLLENRYVSGRYAEILEVPDGTTIDEFYAMAGIGGGTEVPSGGGSAGSGKRGGEGESGEGETVYQFWVNTASAGIAQELGRDAQTALEAAKAAPDSFEYVSGVIHGNGKRMTVGFRQYWPRVRSMVDSGAGLREVRAYLRQLAADGIIQEYEIDVALNKLGVDGSGGNGGR